MTRTRAAGRRVRLPRPQRRLQDAVAHQHERRVGNVGIASMSCSMPAPREQAAVVEDDLARRQTERLVEPALPRRRWRESVRAVHHHERPPDRPAAGEHVGIGSLTVMTRDAPLRPATLRPAEEPARRPAHPGDVPGVEVDVARVVDDRHAVALADAERDRDAHERHPVDEVAGGAPRAVAPMRPDLERDRHPPVQTAPRPAVEGGLPGRDRRRVGGAGTDRARSTRRRVVVAAAGRVFARDLGRPVPGGRVRHA